MIVLGIDTSLDACAVALIDGDVVCASLSEQMNKGQAERLAPMARDAMQAAHTQFAQIERIAVTKGPGSFTGVRVGLSFARALALALGKPCLGVSTLEALALERGEAGLRGALIETPGSSYFALYENGEPLVAPCAIERGEQERLIAGRAVDLSGPGVTADAAALALRAARLDPALYPADPLYLRAPHVTPPAARS